MTKMVVSAAEEILVGEGAGLQDLHMTIGKKTSPFQEKISVGKATIKETKVLITTR